MSRKSFSNGRTEYEKQILQHFFSQQAEKTCAVLFYFKLKVYLRPSSSWSCSGVSHYKWFCFRFCTEVCKSTWLEFNWFTHSSENLEAIYINIVSWVTLQKSYWRKFRLDLGINSLVHAIAISLWKFSNRFSNEIVLITVGNLWI